MTNPLCSAYFVPRMVVRDLSLRADPSTQLLTVRVKALSAARLQANSMRLIRRFLSLGGRRTVLGVRETLFDLMRILCEKRIGHLASILDHK